MNALVNWLTPSPDLDTDLEQARAAKRLVSRMPVLATRQPAGLAQVYQQVGLPGKPVQAKGVLVAAGGEGRGEYREVLVELVVLLARCLTPSSPTAQAPARRLARGAPAAGRGGPRDGPRGGLGGGGGGE